MGILHADERYRPSLSADLMEPVRPIVDGLVLALANGRRFRRCELYETREGLCRVGPSLARELTEFSSAMRLAVEPHAKRLAQMLVGKAQARSTAAGPAADARYDRLAAVATLAASGAACLIDIDHAQNKEQQQRRDRRGD